MNIYNTDSYTQQANYAMKNQAIIAYEYDGNSAVMFKDVHGCRDVDGYSDPQYQWVFEGRDIKSDYTEYHTPDYSCRPMHATQVTITPKRSKTRPKARLVLYNWVYITKQPTG